MQKLRLGIIGCGKMMKNHVSGVKLLDGVELTAFADLIPENAMALAEDWPDAYVTGDYRTVLAYVDAVLVALPHDLHYECGMFIAKQKKHILMEKPLCNTEEECIRLIRACEDAGVTLMCGYPIRYWPAIHELKAMVDSGVYGKVMQMSVWTEQLTQLDELSWGATSRLGGGQFFSHGCHYVDLLMWFMGNPVRGVHFGTNIGTPWMLKEGTSTAIFQFENGALGYHGATWGARGTKLGWNLQLMMEKGLLEFDRYAAEIRLYNQNAEHDFGKQENRAYTVLWHDSGKMNKQTQYEIRHFAACIRDGKKPDTDGRTAMKSLQVIWKMYDAEKHNTVADLTDIKMYE